ncbi:TRAP transporter small permease [Marinobacter fonticola]|uniref:TRAP transporter small permease n=1 Tax=Marinobacter fonticola TaxID=2603215 RepID=UPI0011E896A7|nr:TRAP transporter small permease [Marinobacter fonticola]
MASPRGASDGPEEPEKKGKGKKQGPFHMLDTGLNVVEQGILITGILVMAATSIVGVFARNMGHSLSFVDELAQILVVIVTFVGVGHGVRNARHIRVSALHDMLPKKGQKILLTFVSFFSCALLALLAVYSIHYIDNLQNSGRVMPSMQLPLWIPYLIVPVGLIVGSAQFFLAGVRNIISEGAWLSWHNPDEYEEELAIEAGLSSEQQEHFERENEAPNADDKEKSNG